MNKKLMILAVFVTTLGTIKTQGSGLPVIDEASMLQESINDAMDYVQYVEEVTQSIQQTANQVEDLKRYGDPSQIVNLTGVDGLYSDLTSGSQLKSTTDLIKNVQGDKAFDFLTSSPLLKDFKQQITIGETKVERDGENYEVPGADIATVENQRKIEEDVLTRREAIKQSIADATMAIQSATTESEVQKQVGVLIGLNGQLGSIDKELDHATSQALVQHIEGQAVLEAKKQAAIEERAAIWADGAKKDVDLYIIDNKGVLPSEVFGNQ